MIKNTNIKMRPIQKIKWHIFLGLFTGGIGNLIYYITIKQKQKQWDNTVQSLNTNTNHNYNH